MSDAEARARACAAAADDKKAIDIVVLDMQGISSFTDYFVIASASSEPQLKAISSGIRQELREKFDTRPIAEDGFPASHWVVIDYGDVIVHLFNHERRSFYGLEELWKDAPQLKLSS